MPNIFYMKIIINMPVFSLVVIILPNIDIINTKFHWEG